MMRKDHKTEQQSRTPTQPAANALGRADKRVRGRKRCEDEQDVVLAELGIRLGLG